MKNQLGVNLHTVEFVSLGTEQNSTEKYELTGWYYFDWREMESQIHTN